MGARPEATGRKALLGPPVGAYSVGQFCQAHNLSPAMFYKMRAAGLGPDVMRAGRRTLISTEAAARWRAQCEAQEAAAHPRLSEPESA